MQELIDEEALKAAIDFNDHCETYSDVNEQIRDTILVYLNAATHQPSGDVVERVAEAITAKVHETLRILAAKGSIDELEWCLREAAKAAIAAMQGPAQVDLEACARAVAEYTYHEHGLETMCYAGVQDFCDREWQHYTGVAKAVLKAANITVKE